MPERRVLHFRDALFTYMPIIPCILGLACARIIFAILTPFNFDGDLKPHAYRYLDIAIPASSYPGGDPHYAVYDIFHALRIGLFAAFLLYLFVKSSPLQKCTIKRIMYACIALSAASALVICISTLFGHPNEQLAIAASIIGALASTGLLFYWLRCARQLSVGASMALLFFAYFLAKGALSVLPLLGHSMEYAVAFILVILQPAIIALLKRMKVPLNQLAEHDKEDHATLRTERTTDWFVIGNTVTLLIFSIILALLRLSFENESLASLASPDILAFAIVFSLAFIVCLFGSIVKAPFAATTICWLMVFVLASATMFLSLSDGDFEPQVNLLTMVLDDFNRILRWFVIIRFMQLGRRDPYFYALLVNITYLVPLWLSSFIPSIDSNVNLVVGILLIGGVAMFAAQSIQATNQAKRAMLDAQQQHNHELKRFEAFVLQNSAVEGATRSGTDALMRKNAAIMGAQFLLSKREVDVLTLYALGHTQAHISEELRVANTTVRTHIRNIYLKTNLHSRQDILDYMSEHVGGETTGSEITQNHR